jgi:hypothetical protein
MGEYDLTDKARKQRAMANRKHGIYAFRDRGESALVDPEHVSSLTELRQLVRSQPGRQALREEMTARVALICYLGFSEVQKWHSDGKPIWESPVLKRASTWMDELKRLLDSFPPDQATFDITDFLSGDQEDEETELSE